MDVPTVTTETHAELVPKTDFVLTNHVDLCDDRSEQKLLIYDQEGRIRWYWSIPDSTSPGIESRYLGDGRILWGGGRSVGGVPEIVSLDHVIDRTEPFPGAGELMFHHDAATLSDGRLLALFETEPTDQGESYIGFGLTAFDPSSGRIAWEWDGQDGVEQGVLDRDGETGDVFHANAFSWEQREDGDRIWVSLCDDYSVIAVEAASGQVLAKLGRFGDLDLYDREGAELDNLYHARCTHGIVAKDNRVLVYDNGRAMDASRVTEYRVDLENGEATFWWSWTEPEWHEGTLGDADWIDDERVLVTQSHNECTAAPAYPGDRTAIVEVDVASNEVAWRLTFDDPHDTNYRSQSLSGCGLFSATTYCDETRARLMELVSFLGW
jgi:hypothetical protein